MAGPSPLVATVLDEHGNLMEDAEVAWSSSDTDVATVDADGVVTARGAGTARRLRPKARVRVAAPRYR